MYAQQKVYMTASECGSIFANYRQEIIYWQNFQIYNNLTLHLLYALSKYFQNFTDWTPLQAYLFFVFL